MSRCLLGAGFILLLLAAHETWRTARDGSTSLNSFFNSDTLYPAALYEDVFVDGYSVQGWTFASATAFYPDVLIYFAARAVTGSVSSAMVVSSATLVVLLLLAVRALLAVLLPVPDRRIHDACLLCFGAVFLLLNAQASFGCLWICLPMVLTYHSGALICTIISWAILVRLWKPARWGWREEVLLMVLFGHVALSTFSDRWIIIHALAPGLATLLGAYLILPPQDVAPSAPRRLIAISATALAAAATGYAALRVLQPGWHDMIQTEAFSRAGMLRCLRFIGSSVVQQIREGDVAHIGAAALAAVSAGVIGRAVLQRLRAKPNGGESSQIDRGIVLFSGFYLVSALLTIAAIVYTGRVQPPPAGSSATVKWSVDTRYFLPTLILPLFVAAYVASRILPVPARRRFLNVFPVALVAGTLALWLRASQTAHADDQPVWNYYPSLVREVDALAEEHGLRHGFASYWRARLITLLSRKNLRVLPVRATPDTAASFAPMVFMANRDWFSQPSRQSREPFRPTFMLQNKRGPDVPDDFATPSAEELESRFGVPAFRTTVESHQLVIYSRPEDDRFQNVAQVDCHFLWEACRFPFGGGVRLPASAMPSEIGEPNLARARKAEEGREKPGFLVSGPNLVVKKHGLYRITVLSSSTGAATNGRMEILLSNPANGERLLLAEQDLTVGERRETIALAPVFMHQLGYRLFIRIHYFGQGSLEIHHVDVLRVP